MANPPPPPEPPDEVVIQTSLLVQHLHEQACLSLLLLLTVTRNLTAAPPPPEPPDLSNMATHFSMELLSYACVSKCYVVVVMQFMYVVLDLLRWICDSGIENYVWYMVIIVQKKVHYGSSMLQVVPCTLD